MSAGNEGPDCLPELCGNNLGHFFPVTLLFLQRCFPLTCSTGCISSPAYTSSAACNGLDSRLARHRSSQFSGLQNRYTARLPVEYQGLLLPRWLIFHKTKWPSEITTKSHCAWSAGRHLVSL